MPTSPTIDRDSSPGARAAQRRELQRRHGTFVWSAMALILVSFLGTVTAVIYAPSSVSTPVFNQVNVGLLLILLQFPLSFTVAVAYRWYAGRHLDPIAGSLRSTALSDLTAKD